jgi:hypothetical protein
MPRAHGQRDFSGLKSLISGQEPTVTRSANLRLGAEQASVAYGLGMVGWREIYSCSLTHKYEIEFSMRKGSEVNRTGKRERMSFFVPSKAG